MTFEFDPFRQRSTGTHLDIVDNVKMIRAHPDTFIEFHCYNRAEVDETEELLTPEERKRVRFFWLTFPQVRAL